MRTLSRLSLTGLLLALTISASAAPDCRLHIRGYELFMANEADLEASARKILLKKGIELISHDELGNGDYNINELLENYESYGGVMMHEYEFRKKSKLAFVPCFAIPLCSPVVLDQQVTAITGLNYKDKYIVGIIQDGRPEKILSKKFNHKYRGKVIHDRKDPAYPGSDQHKDLALAVANTVPKCSELKKNSPR